MNFRWPWAEPTKTRRTRLALDLEDTLAYAVGDVHGCHEELLALEAKIEADAAFFSGRKLIIMLGDYVDRGPASSSVLDHLLRPPPPGFERICLAGNHEIAMLDYCEGRITLGEWTSLGGDATLISYGLDPAYLGRAFGSARKADEHIRKSIPDGHMHFLHDLPVLVETPHFVFVHAGIRPGLSLDEQSDDDLTRIRSDFLHHPHGLRQWIVHGHTPVPTIVPEGRRLNIDTGAFYSGCLSAVRIWRKKGHVIST
ncbi:metallophosphoesterase family protein [Mesorhizobium sp. 1B3]|uniref:metallophosphoesterase family protein n=1 Tax=Mesorhizobium sp. 1B3 TaxID=3243599 RepID=UPI003D981225